MKGIYILLSLLILASTSLEAKKKKYPNGDYYEGEWKKNQPNGLGKMIYANGETYEGEWFNGLFHGKGKMTYQNGNIYEGSWENGLSNGTGKMIYSNGNEYDGLWKNGKIIKGKGKIVGLNGSIYEGEWNEEWNNISSQNEDVFNGTNLSNNNSLTLQGTYLNSMGGLFWGKCIMQTTNTSFVTFNGLLPNDWNVTNGTLRYSVSVPTGIFASYNGDILNFKRNGNGKIEFNKYNIRILGTWKNDKILNGTGNFTYENQTCNFTIISASDNNSYYIKINNIPTLGKKSIVMLFQSDLASIPELIISDYKKYRIKERQRQELERKKDLEEIRKNEILEQKRIEAKYDTEIANYIWPTSLLRRLYNESPIFLRSIIGRSPIIISGIVEDIYLNSIYLDNGIVIEDFDINDKDIISLRRGQLVYAFTDVRAAEDDYIVFERPRALGKIMFDYSEIKSNIDGLKSILLSYSIIEKKYVFELLIRNTHQ